jgi:hypothetical protein
MNIYNMSFEFAVFTETERAHLTLKWFIIAVDFFAMDDILGVTWKFFFAELALGRFFFCHFI